MNEQATGRETFKFSEVLSALSFVLLLKDAGCSSTSSGVVALFEADYFEVKKTLKTTDRSRLPESLLYVARTVSPGGNLRTRAWRFLAVGMEGRRANRRLVRIRCRSAMPMEKALAILNEESGEKLCPGAWAPSTSWYRRGISEVEQRLRRRSRRHSVAVPKGGGGSPVRVANPARREG